nr:TauD/TfdA family dioxygenase [Aristophania vespae]
MLPSNAQNLAEFSESYTFSHNNENLTKNYRDLKFYSFGHQNWHIERLSPQIGAIIHGIDMNASLSAQTIEELTQLLHRHQVLFMRKQNLTPHQHRDFARAFGSLHLHPVFPTVPDVPEAIILDTALNDLKDNALWHTDVTFSETPPLGAILVARHLPPLGGDTLWASASGAYDALSPYMKEHLNNLTALHDITRSFPISRFGRTEEERKKWLENRANHPPVEHPVIRIHPRQDNGRFLLMRDLRLKFAV